MALGWPTWVICIVCVTLLLMDAACGCITLLNGEWKPLSLEERTKRANVVLTARILFTSPIPGKLLFYSATFRVLSVLKGWDVIKHLYDRKSHSVKRLHPDIIASAKGFADRRLCFSSVEVGETYVLFLGHKVTGEEELVAKYDDIFGAAELLYKRTERDILKSLGWNDWASWSSCTAHCGTGTQLRKRECLHHSSRQCQGPKEQMKECNTFSCASSTDILNILVNEKAGGSPNSKLKNGVLASLDHIVPSAPTYLLFPNDFPKNFVILAEFLGPVRSAEFLLSSYSANNKMHFGIKLSPYAIDFVYDKAIDAAVNIRRHKSFHYEFTEKIWYSIGILVQFDQIRVTANCEEIGSLIPDEKIMEDFDMFGMMFIGADAEEKEAQVFKGEISQITVSADPVALWHQCGKLTMDSPVYADTPLLEGEASGDEETDTKKRTLSNVDDSESGDVDDEDESKSDERREESSGEGQEGIVIALTCFCENGGNCKSDGSCNCTRGWKGPNCTIALCDPPCQRGGTCVKPYTCACGDGTTGNQCQYSLCSFPCQHGGVCVGPDVCKCAPGYEGAQCQQVSCSKACDNGGRCDAHGACVCPHNFKGDRCQFPQKCQKFVTKLVSYTQPAVQAVVKEHKVPCGNGVDGLCTTKRIVYENTNRVSYRPEYVCAP